MNELVTLRKIEQSKLAIREVKSLDEIKKIIDQGEALKAYAESAKMSSEIQADIAELNLRAKRRLGEISAALEIAKGNQYKKVDCPSGGHSKTATLSSVGISRQRASEAEKIAAIPERVFEEKIAGAKAAADKITKSLFKEAEAEFKKEKRQESIIEQANKEAAMPSGEYSCIVIDPPWNYGTSYDPESRRVANPYPEMTFEQIAALEIKAKKDSVMFLWTTHKFIWDAKKLLEKWGFEYRSMLVWDKEKMGMGDLFRMQCEFCLVGIKGKPVLNNPQNIRDIIREPRREHSRKPEAFYKMVGVLCPGNKIEYFAREKREGYVVFGNDTDKF